MVVESRAGRFATLAAVILATASIPLVRSNLVRLFSLPGYDDASLVTIDRDTIHHNNTGTVRPYVMEFWRRNTNSFASFHTLERWTAPEGMVTEKVSAGLLQSVGVKPWRGTLPGFSADTLKREPEAVASFEWAHGDESWVGRKVQVGYRAYRIAAIMPAQFELLNRGAGLWIPLTADAKNLELIGRLKPGVSPLAAQKELRDLSRQAHHWGTRKLEVITLAHNRHSDLWFVLSVLTWNLIFVAALACRGWYRFVQSGSSEVTKRQQLRFLGMLLVKTALILSPMVVIWIVFVDFTVQQYLVGLSGWAIPVFFWIFLLTAWGLTIWSLNDHQNRCRTCLEHLRMPVGRGSWSSLVLDRPATESICVYGHGTLYVPGTKLLNLDSVNWTGNREMWGQLAVR